MLRKTRHELNDLACLYGIPYTKYKNKRLLVDAIERKQRSPSTRCYNTVDPCTLESIDDIDSKYLVEWTQYNHRFGADIRSIKSLFKHKKVAILPWAVDLCSGVQRSCISPELFETMFDMKQNMELLEKIESFQVVDDEQPEEQPDEYVSIEREFLQEIEKLFSESDPYAYGVILNLLKLPIPAMYENMAGRMLRVLTMLYQYASDGELLQIQFDIYYCYCYCLYTTNGLDIKDRVDHLRYIIFVLNQFNLVMGEQGSFIIALLFSNE